ncbi:MAG: EAL domain-containing protein [Novosphingobium sp.]|nr:EAL domain-containing protein [Novosphingobium sp.]
MIGYVLRKAQDRIANAAQARRGRASRGARAANNTKSRGRSGADAGHTFSEAAKRSRRFLIGQDWVWLAPLMLIGIAAIAVSSRALPPVSSMLMFAAAILPPACNRHLVRWERKYPDATARRFAVMVAGVPLPMFFFGAALALWTVTTGAAGWTGTIEILVVLGLLAATILHGRLGSIIAAQVGLWAGAASASISYHHFAVVGAGAVVAIYLTHRQLQEEAIAISSLRDAEREQRRAEMLLVEYESSGHGWFWETDSSGAISYVSPKICQSSGRGGRQLTGRPFTELFTLHDKSQSGERTLTFHLSVRSAFHDLAVRAAAEDGTERWWSISGRPIYDEYHNFLGFRGAGTDLTDTLRSKEKATRLAQYDALTGLANRMQMAELLDKLLGSSGKDHQACAVFLLDLDRFKQVNDTLGHPAGDGLLEQVAQRLSWTVGDAGKVGRLGGDEFEVLLPGTRSRDDLAELAQRIIVNLSQPYSIEEQRVIIGASIGIALAPDDGTTPEALIRNADLALYAAKDGGRGRHHFYADDLHRDAEERRQLEQDLRDAISNGDLMLHYQPVVHTVTEKITGFEALLRWNHPIHGPMSPAKFIPVAEDAGLITQIGEWALRTACRDLSGWPKDVRVAVNVSPLQFSNPALPGVLMNAIAAAQVDPARIELEITESVFLNDDMATEAMFAALKKVGVRLALDDFGTGYSALGYLKKAPFDKIKIDQSFVRGATIKGSRNGAIIAAIVNLAEALGMETTAEGVETLDELDLVRMLGVSHVQGYIYEKPLAADAASRILISGVRMVAQGHRSSRPARQTMLRRVVLEHAGECYMGTIRNISATGAMVEGLWNVPAGTPFNVYFSADVMVRGEARWSKDDRMGLEFAEPLAVERNGRIVLSPQGSDAPREPVAWRKAG